MNRRIKRARKNTLTKQVNFMTKGAAAEHRKVVEYLQYLARIYSENKELTKVETIGEIAKGLETGEHWQLSAIKPVLYTEESSDGPVDQA